MTSSDLLKAWPFLYHLTARENVPGIVHGRELLSSKSILLGGDRPDLIRRRRLQHEEVVVGETRYLLRDQLPLQKGHMALDEGMAFESFVELVNTLIFFWPGDERGPIRMGLNHFARYADESPTVLRVAFGALLDANTGAIPKLSTVNSGAPRCHPKAGKGRRGAGTFVEPLRFDGNVRDIREIAFEGRLQLPKEVDLGTIRDKLWLPSP